MELEAVSRQELESLCLRIRDKYTAGCCDGPVLYSSQTLQPEKPLPSNELQMWDPRFLLRKLDFDIKNEPGWQGK